jgi:hypothetical protein
VPMGQHLPDLDALDHGGPLLTTWLKPAGRRTGLEAHELDTTVRTHSVKKFAVPVTIDRRETRRLVLRAAA